MNDQPNFGDHYQPPPAYSQMQPTPPYHTQHGPHGYYAGQAMPNSPKKGWNHKKAIGTLLVIVAAGVLLILVSNAISSLMNPTKEFTVSEKAFLNRVDKTEFPFHDSTLVAQAHDICNNIADGMSARGAQEHMLLYPSGPKSWLADVQQDGFVRAATTTICPN